MGVTEGTYYRWRKTYGGMGVTEIRRLKQLEEENAKLKRLVADLSLDKTMLQDALAPRAAALGLRSTRLSVRAIVRPCQMGGAGRFPLSRLDPPW